MIFPILNEFIDSRLNDYVFNRTEAEGLQGFFNFVYSVLYFCVHFFGLVCCGGKDYRYRLNRYKGGAEGSEGI